MKTFDTIAGVPVAYDRADSKSYGTRGTIRTNLGPVTETFLAALEAWMTELGQLCPWGLPDLLVTGGVRGDPSKHSRHTEGRAIDIDALFWKDRPPLITKQALDYPIAYLAVEALLRRHFGTVLDFWYNGDHHDHWHVDDGHPVGWTPSYSYTVFLQAALTHVWNDPVVIDGRPGALTTAAWDRAGCVGKTWEEWLKATAVKAWEQLAALS